MTPAERTSVCIQRLAGFQMNIKMPYEVYLNLRDLTVDRTDQATEPCRSLSAAMFSATTFARTQCLTPPLTTPETGVPSMIITAETWFRQKGWTILEIQEKFGFSPSSSKEDMQAAADRVIEAARAENVTLAVEEQYLSDVLARLRIHAGSKREPADVLVRFTNNFRVYDELIGRVVKAIDFSVDEIVFVVAPQASAPAGPDRCETFTLPSNWQPFSLSYDRARALKTAPNDELFLMYHPQDCCEEVKVEDITGNLADLILEPLVEAEEVRQIMAPEEYEGLGAESGTWTFYKFRTQKGCVTLRWVGTSNGCYSEEVELIKLIL